MPSSETIAFLAGFFDVDPTWLLTGQGSMDAHLKKIVDGFTSQQVRAVYEVDQIIQDLTAFRGRILQEPLLAADYVGRIHEELLKVVAGTHPAEPADVPAADPEEAESPLKTTRPRKSRS